MRKRTNLSFLIYNIIIASLSYFYLSPNCPRDSSSQRYLLLNLNEFISAPLIKLTSSLGKRDKRRHSIIAVRQLLNCFATITDEILLANLKDRFQIVQRHKNLDDWSIVLLQTGPILQWIIETLFVVAITIRNILQRSSH